jgi:hypothetical protein
MPKIKLDSLQEGMVVAADVRNMDDMLLLPAGCELSGRHIQILRTWGVAEVMVEATGEAEAAADPLAKLSPEEAARLEAEVRSQFHNYDEANVVQKELLRLMLRRRAVQLTQKAPHGAAH